jgi:hypothetical protein
MMSEAPRAFLRCYAGTTRRICSARPGGPTSLGRNCVAGLVYPVCWFIYLSGEVVGFWVWLCTKPNENCQE